MKLKPSVFKICLSCFFISLLGAVLIFGATCLIFLDTPWDWRQPAIICIWFISSVALYVMSLTQNFYVLENKFICHHKFNKEMYYNFKDVIYIDKDYSEKNKTILFVTNKGDIRYIGFDKKRLLYQAMLERCKNLITYEEMLRRFPNTKKINPPK